MATEEPKYTIFDEAGNRAFKILAADKVRTVGEPIFARFNSPFQLWFLRRNEIWLQVVQ